MSEAAHYERVREQFESLGMSAALSELDRILEKTAREERSPTWLLDQLFTTELTARFERRVAANLKLSGIPAKKTLDQFDFVAQPSVPRATMEELATYASYVKHRRQATPQRRPALAERARRQPRGRYRPFTRPPAT